MSRRKQHTPRHLDSDEGGELISKPLVPSDSPAASPAGSPDGERAGSPASPETAEPRSTGTPPMSNGFSSYNERSASSSSTIGPDEVMSESTNDVTAQAKSPAPTRDPAVDDDCFVCPVCNMDFLERSDLVAHKKMCTAAMAAVTRKRNFDYDEEDKENLLTEPPNKKKLVNGVLSDDETEQFDGMDAPSDGEESMRHVRQASSLLGKYGNSDRMSTVGDSRRGSTSDRRSDSSEMISPVDDTMGDGEGKDSHSSAITQQMAMFSDSNVKLERLDSTKVAVAQIAENNNFAPNEIAMLLYSLHQQQLLQLQLLQQLQSQIASGVTPSIQNLPAMLVPGATALLAPMAGINSPMMGSMAPTHLVSPPTSAVASSQSTTSAPTTASLQHAICSAATNTKSSVITTASSAPSDQTTTKSTDHYHSHATNNHHHGNNSRNNSATTSQQHQSERQRHRHNDEQEQGQEHERSYTCNVCNNRFPSRGSLKLHMARHHDHYGHNQSSSSHHISSSESRDRHINSNASSSSSSGDAANTSPIMIAPLASTDGNDHHRSKERRGEEDHPQHAVGDAENRSAGTSLPNGETSPTNVAEGSGQTSPTAEDSANGEPGSNQGQHLVFPPFSKEQPPPLINSHGPPGHHPGGPLGLIPPPMGMLGPMPPMPMPGAPPLPPFGYENPFVRKSILPSQHEDDSMEEFMEIDKSETSKLQALVENLDKKLTDPNECAICNRILSCKSALQMHYRTHTGERPFKCKICGRAFTTKGNLKTHMGVHRSKPPMRMLHQCPVCHKQFTNALVLQQHIRMHTGEIPKEMQMPTDFAGPSPGAPGYMPGFHGFPFLPPPMGFVPPGLRPPLMPGMEPDMRNHKISPYTPRKEDTKENNSDKYSDREDYNDRERDGYDERNSRDDNETKNDRDDYDARPYPSHMSDMIDRDMQEAASVASEKASRSSHHNDHESGDVSGDENNYERSAMSPVSDRPASPYDKSTTSEYSKRDDDKYCTDNYQQSASSAEGSTSQTGTPRYSSSLIALEERVNSIDTTSPLTQYGMHRASEHEMLSAGNHSNRSSSPTTPENGGKGSSPAGVSSSSFPITPTLSSSPNFGLPEMFSARPPGFNGFGAPEVSPKSFNSPRSTTCNICFKTFACRSALDIHYRSHTKERPFKCEICDRGFSTRGNMRQHMLTHKNRDNSEKNDGSLETIQEQNSPQGESQHDSSDVPTGDSRPTSPYNSQTSVNSPGVVSSPSKQQQQYDDEPLAHNRPPSPPYNPNNHRQHNSSSTSPHVTDSNAESTKTAASNAGSDSKSQSSASTTPQHGMDYGRRTQNNMKHVCRVCQKPFSSASALQIHMRTHTGDKPFKCTVCGKAFTTRGNLKVHMGTHMWNNAPSRRGRRMSIDTMPQLPPFPNNQPKDGGDYYNFPHHRELFPFPPFQGFGLPNGLSPKMNEISVIQGLNGNMPHMLPMLDNMMPGHPLMKTGMKDLPPWKQDSRQDEKVSEQNNNKTSSGLISMGGSGELDLSLRKSASDVKSPGGSTPAVSQPLPPSSTHHSQLSPSHHSPGRTSSSTSDSRHQSSPASLMQSPPPSSVSLNSSWMWKTTCHLCNQILPNVHALEVHMQNHVTRQEASSPKPVIA